MTIAGIAAGAGTVAPSTEAQDPWALMARRDLQAMHRIILENHPGPVDGANPSFKDWLERGYREALARAGQARNFGAYAATLRRYTAGFRDGHLQMRFHLRATKVRWPGFAVALQQGRYVVVQAQDGDPRLPPVGAELVSCDGVPTATLFERVWPTVAGPDIEAQRVSSAPLLLRDEADPELKPPASCVVRVGSETRTLELRYRDIAPDALTERTKGLAFGDSPGFGVHAFGKGGLWISIPSFQAQEREATLSALRGLVGQAATWRDAPVLVFDVRGNEGGDSTWGGDLLRGLYGADFFRAAVEDAPEQSALFVEWRVSRENAEYLEALVDSLSRQHGADSEIADEMRRASQALEAALKRRQSLVRVPEEARTAKRPDVPPTSPVRGRVFLLTDGRCASACLDFADALLALPGTTHVGLPTSADSVYMEARSAKLPSGAAELSLPIKVYRNRPRGHNVPLVPRHRYEGDLGDTARLEQWLLGLAGQG